MKKYIVTTLILTFFVGILFITSKVEATVGGETIIHNFKYNPIDESLYYNFQSYGGKGCPPELMKLSLNSEKVEKALSCDQGLKLLSESNNYSGPEVDLEIERITKYFKPLTPLDLKTNNISIDVNFLKDENYSFDYSQLMRKHFTVSVYQGSKKVKDLNITGCNLNQPFIFQGYAIPGYNKRIALLVSTKGDCFEGGYVSESLYTIAGVDNLDKNTRTNFYKGSSALLPNEGNLVIYESDKINTLSISLGQFIELLIAIGVISPDKASAARAIFSL